MNQQEQVEERSLSAAGELQKVKTRQAVRHWAAMTRARALELDFIDMYSAAALLKLASADMEKMVN